ncbi:hypothetical protein G6F37_003844 [Rhizopus arrhizus]|nr:hypothetical protein G6F38_003231 [Rhizopus arrhizus]KAG1160592.1 hypothetical protein G6F37_003844 [Rhizopus arrhizus]
MEHEDYIKDLLDDDSQLFADNIIEKLTKQFQDFSISKSQLNHHLRSTVQITVKKPHFEAEARNSIDNLEIRYEWFMNWKDKDRGYTKNCVFIDEARFHINMRNNWVRSPAGTRAVVKTPKIKPAPKFATETVAKKKRKGNSGKKRAVAEVNDEEATPETLSSRIGEACNDVRFSDLYSFCHHSKRQIVKCYTRTPF